MTVQLRLRVRVHAIGAAQEAVHTKRTWLLNRINRGVFIRLARHIRLTCRPALGIRQLQLQPQLQEVDHTQRGTAALP